MNYTAGTTIARMQCPSVEADFRTVLLVGFVRGRDDTASRRGFTQLYFNPLRFVLHSNPPKFADEMKNFHRQTFIVLRGGDFSTV